MSIKKVEAFQTDDGRLFLSPNAAVKHQVTQRRRRILLEEFSSDQGVWSYEQTEQFADRILTALKDELN